MRDALVLFDIDGTLIRRAGPHHREALVEAVRIVTGLDTTTDHIPVHGMLDRDILAWMMRDGGATGELIARVMPEIVECAQDIYVHNCPDLQDKTCPGARELLASLNASGVPVGLVTGNLTRIGWKKMERAGLKEYFRFGVFAEMAEDRTGLVRMAIERARNEGWITDTARISLIGDAPADVIAARANHAKAIAVRTGVSSPEELVAESPDLLIEDLTHLNPAALL